MSVAPESVKLLVDAGLGVVVESGGKFSDDGAPCTRYYRYVLILMCIDMCLVVLSTLYFFTDHTIIYYYCLISF